MTWALKRQFIYIAILILFILGVAALIIYPQFKKEPTCFDRKQNGVETGVDCGGICLKACLAQVDPVSVLWARSFKVVDGRYNAVAYLENHNPNTAIKKINYRFRFADANNIFIGKRDGSTYIPPSGKFAIFEPGVGVGNSIPVYTTFEFTQVPEWTFVSQEKLNQLKVLVSDINLVDEDKSPVLSAVVKNDSFFTIENIDVVAILYDESHNAISASRTYLKKMSGEESKDVHFTWPEAFSSKVVKKEIIPMYDIFSVQLK